MTREKQDRAVQMRKTRAAMKRLGISVGTKKISCIGCIGCIDCIGCLFQD